MMVWIRRPRSFLFMALLCHTPPTWTGVRPPRPRARPVQEAWIRHDRSDGDDIDNLGAWLTTVVAHVCLDLLRARQTRPQVSLDAVGPEAGQAPGLDVEQALLLADSLGPALLVVLDTLAPAERVAFVLHDMFAISFDEIAAVLGRSPVATRQLASRARRRVQGAPADPSRRRSAAPARDRRRLPGRLTGGQFRRPGGGPRPRRDRPRRRARRPLRGCQPDRRRTGPGPRDPRRPGRRRGVQGPRPGARRALIDGDPGAVWVLRGQVRAAFLFTVEDERIVDIDLTMDPTRLAGMNVALLATGDPEE